ncbi:hypothetical protein, partial [Micromonospora sp. NPDC003776]
RRGTDAGRPQSHAGPGRRAAGRPADRAIPGPHRPAVSPDGRAGTTDHPRTDDARADRPRPDNERP